LLYRWHERKSAKVIEAAARADAFDDFPWLLVFREFDRAFPDAAFILTVRQRDDVWLESIQRHVKRGSRSLGHFLAYGSYDPVADAERHLQTYRAHDQAARAYFAVRPAKLLELCFEKGDGWAELCEFLGNVNVPAVPFPRINTKEQPLIPVEPGTHKSKAPREAHGAGQIIRRTV
jgi:hypothetical protein